MKILTVIQARINSTRLPAKVMLPLAEKPLLVRMVERVKNAALSGTVIVATTTDAADNKIEELCHAENIFCYRGHPIDLLDRHYQAAVYYQADLVLKIPSDCPLIDAKIIDKAIGFYMDNIGEYDFVSNLHPTSYPDGNDVELMTFSAIEKAWKNATKKFEREHTTPYIWENPSEFRIGSVLWEMGKDYSKTHRWTIDYPEDYEFIKKVYDELYHQNPQFDLYDILNLVENRPDIFNLNNKYAGEYWYKNHVNELKTVSYKQPNKKV
ncbi:MAG TPA: glycosyltransferase family protein [Bacteroidia bacterium]|nr:glycosyltransferase family protein [Bacteroidia bacterium]